MIFSGNIVKIFGTANLDEVIEQLAPKTMVKIQDLADNQQIIYDKLKEHEKQITRVEEKLDLLLSITNELYESILKKPRLKRQKTEEVACK